ncbi:MAG: divalent-cation tolerance protein CutA [Akkermansiaceae bacterium]
MTEALVILCTFPNREEARQIGTQLVERQHAACVTLLPAVESIYRWKGKLCQESEVLVLMKTTRAAFPRLQRDLAVLHSYETPEIIALPVEAGTEPYLAWLESHTRV